MAHYSAPFDQFQDIRTILLYESYMCRAIRKPCQTALADTATSNPLQKTEIVTDEKLIYQRIGEFVVSFQWLEDRLREIGWFIINPDRGNWPPQELRTLKNEKLIDKVYELFLRALPKCGLGQELETYFITSFAACAETLHQLRRDRNRILHSAFIEIKAGHEVVGLMRSKLGVTMDKETGNTLCDHEMLSHDSFANEMRRMGETAVFLNRAYIQLIHRFPLGNANPWFQQPVSASP